MDNELIKKIKHDISEFHPEKFKLKLVDVGQILEEAERKRREADRRREKEQSPISEGDRVLTQPDNGNSNGNRAPCKHSYGKGD